MDAPPSIPTAIRPDRLVPVVVGGHLRAELGDRPAAQRLARRMDEALRACSDRLRACVLTDLWYLNDDRFRGMPAISVGPPELNALTAFLADRMPSVLSQEGVYVIQLDLERVCLDAACWGSSHEATASACELFESRHLQEHALALAERSLADAER